MLAVPDDGSVGSLGGIRGDMERNRNSPAEPKNGTGRSVSFTPDYLRRIIQVEALPENSTGADKGRVHKAHADVGRHIELAKPR